MKEFIQNHPIIILIFIIQTLLGSVLGYFFFQEGSALENALLGALCGMGVSLLMTATRMFRPEDGK